MRLADYVIRFVEKLGVKDIFTVTGGGSIFLCDALSKNKNVNYYCCHHEQAVAMATEAYARAREGLGVSLVTAGPGGTNAITGVAGSWMDSVPHLVLSGQAFLSQTIGDSGLRQLGVQEINIIDLVKPITKYAVMVKDPNTIRYHLEKAVFIATTGRPGPVWLDLPANIQNASIDEEQLEGLSDSERQLPSRYQTDIKLKDKVRQVVDLLRFSRRPLIHVGQGVRLARAQAEFMSLVENHRIPFVTARNANDLIPTDHSLYVGRPGTFAQRAPNFAVQNADVYIAIGTRLSLPQTGYDSKDFARGAKRVMVDIDQAELDKKTLDIHLKIHSDAKLFLVELNRQLSGTAIDAGEWVERCRSWKEKYRPVPKELENQERFVNSYYFVDILSDRLSGEDLVVTDMGIAFQGTHQAFRVKQGQRFFTNCGFAPMGWGLPAAVGACVGSGKRRTVCITGDGGLLMNIQELATVMHHYLPVKLFILNNGGYLTIKETQQYGFESRYMGVNEETGISFPDFMKIAEAHRIPAWRVEDHPHLSSVITETLQSSGPSICEIMMNPDQPQIFRAIPRKKADGTTEYTPFEDLYPFLDRDELQKNMMLDTLKVARRNNDK